MNNMNISDNEYADIVDRAFTLLYHGYSEAVIKKVLALRNDELPVVLADARALKNVNKAIRPTLNYLGSISKGLHYVICLLYIDRGWSVKRIADTLKLDPHDVRESMQKTFKDLR